MACLIMDLTNGLINVILETHLQSRFCLAGGAGGVVILPFLGDGRDVVGINGGGFARTFEPGPPFCLDGPMIKGTRIRDDFAVSVGRWAYLSCECFVQIDGAGAWAIFSYECAACGNTNLRFIHTLENMDTEQQIQVGIECAALLVSPDDCDLPRLAENETRRKERWRREVYRKPGRCSTDAVDLENRGKL